MEGLQNEVRRVVGEVMRWGGIVCGELKSVEEFEHIRIHLTLLDEVLAQRA